MASSTNNLKKTYERINSSTFSHGLPVNQNTVIKLLSEPNEMAYKQLCKVVGELPVEERLTQSQLDGTLYELIRTNYLTSFMENGDVVYMLQVDMGKKPPPQRHEQHLFRKLDLGSLNLDELRSLKKEDTNP